MRQHICSASFNKATLLQLRNHSCEIIHNSECRSIESFAGALTVALLTHPRRFVFRFVSEALKRADLEDVPASLFLAFGCGA